MMPFPNTLAENNKPIEPVRSEFMSDFHLLMGAWKKVLDCMFYGSKLD